MIESNRWPFRQKRESLEVDMSPSLIAQLIVDVICVCVEYEKPTRKDDAQTNHKRPLRLSFCVMYDTMGAFQNIQKHRYADFSTQTPPVTLPPSQIICDLCRFT